MPDHQLPIGWLASDHTTHVNWRPTATQGLAIAEIVTNEVDHPMPFDPALIGQPVSTVRRRSNRPATRRPGILINAETDPEYRDRLRALILTRSGDYTLDQILRDARWDSLVSASTMPLSDIAGLVSAHEGWSFVVRNRLSEIIPGDTSAAPLRVMDGVYLVSERPGNDPEDGGLVDMPDGDVDLKRLLLVMQQVDGLPVYVGYSVATGNRVMFNLETTRVHRVFQATSVDWCPERVSAVENVLRYMREAYQEARRDDTEIAAQEGTHRRIAFERGSDLRPETVGLTDLDSYHPDHEPASL